MDGTEQALEGPAHDGAKLLICGLDSLYVSFYLDVAGSALDLDLLEHQKVRLQQTRQGSFGEVTLGSEAFALQPFGKNPYRYILANKAFEVRLGEHIRPSCHVQFFSHALWTMGLVSTVERFREWCSSLNLEPKLPEVVSRADWAFDYHLPAVDFEPSHFVSRAAKDTVWRQHGKVQTVTFGTGATVIRVYDKVAEIEQASDKAWFFELWGQQINVWRIEFQLRRERLQLAGIATIDDLRELQNDLLRELASNHTTLRRPSPDDSNRSRWPLHPIWIDLQKAIASLPQTGLIANVDPQMPLWWREYQQLKSLYGSLKGFGAVSQLLDGSEESPPLGTVLARLRKRLDELHDSAEWAEDLSRRVKGYRLGQW